MPTSIDVARLMASKFNKQGRLSHRDVIREIQAQFGSEHLYMNSNGNWAISRVVLKSFKELTERGLMRFATPALHIC